MFGNEFCVDDQFAESALDKPTYPPFKKNRTKNCGKNRRFLEQIADFRRYGQLRIGLETWRTSERL